MNILHIAHRLPWPPVDGGKKCTFGLVQGYRYHHSVTSYRLICMCPREEASWFFEWRSQGVPVECELIDARNSVLRFLSNTAISDMPYTMEKYRRESFSQRLSVAMSVQIPDLVQFESLHTSIYADLVRQHAPRAALVLRSHNAEHLILERLADTEKNQLKKRLIKVQAKRLRDYEAAAMGKFDLILAITPSDANRFKVMNPRIANRVVVVPAGAEVPSVLPPAPLPPVAHSSPLRLVHIAAMDWLPNQSALRWLVDNVLPLLDVAGFNYHLDIVGKGMPAELASLAGPKITVHGFVQDLSPITSAAHVALVPLHVGGGMRVKILDYWALGIPVVATTIGAEGLVDAEREVVAIGDSAVAFAEAIVRLGSRPDVREAIRTAAFDKVQREYSWSGIISGLLARYGQMLAPKP